MADLKRETSTASQVEIPNKGGRFQEGEILPSRKWQDFRMPIHISDLRRGSKSLNYVWKAGGFFEELPKFRP